MAGVGDLSAVVPIAYSQHSRNPLIAVVGELVDDNDSHYCSDFWIVREL
jgi:hypothetical protein